jgi:hypothetical protein
MCPQCKSVRENVEDPTNMRMFRSPPTFSKICMVDKPAKYAQTFFPEREKTCFAALIRKKKYVGNCVSLPHDSSMPPCIV